MEKVSLAAKFGLFDAYWTPKIVADLNDSYVKVAKLKGEWMWHRHEQEDERFLVVKGRLLLKLRDQDVWLEPGELFVVPRGVEHLPIADEDTHVVLVEPKSTAHTGDIVDDRTVATLERI